MARQNLAPRFIPNRSITVQRWVSPTAKLPQGDNYRIDGGEGVSFQTPEGGQPESGEFALDFANIVLAEGKIVDEVTRAGPATRRHLIDFLLQIFFHRQAMASKLFEALQQMFELVPAESGFHVSSSPGKTRLY
jgi:hypothetical protein